MLGLSHRGANSSAVKELAPFHPLSGNWLDDDDRLREMLTNKAKYALLAMIDLTAEGGILA